MENLAESLFIQLCFSKSRLGATALRQAQDKQEQRHSVDI